MIYHSTQSDDYMWYLFLRGKKGKKLKHTNTKILPKFILVLSLILPSKASISSVCICLLATSSILNSVIFSTSVIVYEIDNNVIENGPFHAFHIYRITCKLCFDKQFVLNKLKSYSLEVCPSRNIWSF